MSRNLNLYNVPNADVAEVLEKAADLYESEKIEWCHGRWLLPLPANKMSACAEGALLLAAGFHWKEVQASGDSLFSRSQPAARAKNELEVALFRTCGKSCLHGWNDSVIGGRRSILRDGYPDLTEPIPAVAKAEVIELMKNTAKDLRNQGEAA